jgi:hypothetical protein
MTVKTTHMFCTLLGCFIFFIAQTSCGASLNSVHIGISPYQGAEESKVIRRHIGQFILEGSPNTTVVVYDAYALTEIAQFQIPQLRFDSPEERARRLAEPFAKLAEWYNRRANKQLSPVLIDSGAIKIPEFLQFLSQGKHSESYAVLMIGNPVNISVEEPSFSMMGDRVPSDGHITANIAASIYGTSEKAGRLHGCIVHLCYLREDIWTNQLVKESIQRFWALFISSQDGKLVNFTADIDRAFATATQNGLSGVGNYQLNPTDSNLEMRVVHERSIPVKDVNKVTIASVPVSTNIELIPATPTVEIAEVNTVSENKVLVPEINTIEAPKISVVTNVPPIPATPTVDIAEVNTVPETNVSAPEVNMIEAPKISMVTNIPSLPVARNGRMGIAAWWLADADVDLYVSVPGQPELYYRNLRNKYGEYYRDIRQANKQGTEQNWRGQWEYVELSEKIPTAGLTCWLNLFKVNRGNTQPISGKVRVQYGDGHIVETPFRFNVTKGNGGADSSKRQSSLYWVPIDLYPAATN